MLRATLNIDSLVNDILDHIPNLIHATVIDPSMGGGQFMKEVERRKRAAGLSVDKIRETCYGYCDDIMDLNYIKNKHKLVGQYKVGNIFEEDTKLKFDVRICNPPYQDSSNKAKNNKLWHKFVLQDIPMNDGGYVAFINPISMFSYIGASEKIMKKYTSEYAIKHVITHDNLEYDPFPGVGISTCHWIAKKVPYNGKTEYNGKVVDLRDRHSILTDGELTVKRIVDKVSSYQNMINFEYQVVEVNNEGKYKYLTSGQKETRSNTIPNNIESLKYVVSFSSSYAKQFTTTKNVGGFNKYILINDEVNVEQIKSFMLSKLMKFYAANYRKTAGFTPAVKNNMIPNLISKKMWTDEDLYKHFKLTKKEIEIVERTK